MATEEFAVVNIENGPVKGIKVQSVLNTDYYSFRGIPYMKAPLGKLRFREAQSPRNWTHPFDATQEGPSYCMTNFMTNVQEGQENAGTINVFTRNLSPKRLLPVMIWVGDYRNIYRANIKFLCSRFTAAVIAEAQAKRIFMAQTTLLSKMSFSCLLTIAWVSSAFLALMIRLWKSPAMLD